MAHSEPVAATVTVEDPGPAVPDARAGWFSRRMGWDARRVVGVDLARGLAMLGMFGAHLHVPREVTVADPSTYGALVHGRSAILFALLAGVSLAIVTGGTAPVTGRAVVDFRLRTLVRALALFALGGLLTMLGTPVMVILEAYAMMFVLALPFLTWPVRRLWLAVGVLVVLGPVVTVAVRTGLLAMGIFPVGAWDIAFGEFYPVATWLVFPLAGIAIGRSDLRSTAVAMRLVAGGAVAALLGYWTGHLVSQTDAARTPPLVDLHGEFQILPVSEVLAGLPRSVLAELLTADPHTGTPFEVLGSGGFVVAVLGVCLLLGRTAVRFVLAPLAAVGALSLTVYSAHIVALRLMLEEYYVDIGSLDHLRAFVLWALVGAFAWRLALGKGPLERGIAWLARRAARYVDRSGERSSRTGEPGSISTGS